MRPEDVIPTYERVGEAWAKSRSGALSERRWLDRLMALAPRSTRRIRVLDLGCGSGRPIAAYLCERGAQVTGVDATATMVAAFARNLPQAEVIQADMRGLDLGRSFDAILAWDSFFHLGVMAQSAMFATFAQHAAQGAALLFTTGDTAGEAIGRVADTPIYHASLHPGIYRSLLERHGFQVVDHVTRDPACRQHTVWLARFTGNG